MRDDFKQRTKDTLARRVNYLCSNPSCPLGTVGPHSDPTKSVSKGVAAHITAASSGGMRYDISLTSEERASAGNGIWLCQNCSKLIDTDESKFTTELLRAWKLVAETQVADSMKANSALEVIANTNVTSQTGSGDTSLNWLTDHVHTAKLSESMPRALQFAKQIGDTALEKWIRLELYGYNTHGGMLEDDIVPDYRGVTGRWMDAYNQMLDISHYPDLAVINSYPFRCGVAKLEEFAAKETMQNIADEQLINVLRQKMGVDVVRFCFSPVEIRGSIDIIRNKLAEKIFDLESQTNTVG